MRTALTALALALALTAAAPAAAEPTDGGQPVRLSDTELAQITGKFILPNGVELALTVTSDTVVNGQLILRTVLAVDRVAQVQAFGRTGQTPVVAYAAGSGTGATAPSGVTVALDRQSGIQTVTPTFSVSRGAVTVGAAGADAGAPTAEALGLTQLALTPGGPAVATADGVVSLQAVRNGSLVTLSGDQLAVSNLVGQSIATAVANSANDRTLDTVTSINIDARDITAYQTGSAMMRVDTLALDAARGLVR